MRKQQKTKTVYLQFTGAAPVSKDILNFMRAALGVPFTEGYGLTECTGATMITLPGDYMTDSVGTIAPCNTVKVCKKTLFISLFNCVLILLCQTRNSSSGLTARKRFVPAKLKMFERLTTKQKSLESAKFNNFNFLMDRNW